MGARGMGEATEWALAMAHAVAELRDRSGLKVEEIAERIGKDPSYVYARLKGRAPFNLNDWEMLSRAFGIHPLELARIASRYAASEHIELEPMVDTTPVELGRRLKALQASPRTSGPDFDVAALLSLAAEREIELCPEQWAMLVEGTFGARVPTRVLEIVAEYTGVALDYLSDLSNEEVREATEAQLELRSAIREVGAESVLARSVGDVSPSALRAIAASLRGVQRRSAD